MIDNTEIVSLINHKSVRVKQGFIFFVIFHKRFCYFSDVCQNVQSLIEEKVGCWEVDTYISDVGAGGG